MDRMKFVSESHKLMANLKSLPQCAETLEQANQMYEVMGAYFQDPASANDENVKNFTPDFKLLALTASLRKEIRATGERAIAERGRWPSPEEGCELAGRIAAGMRRHLDCQATCGDGCLALAEICHSIAAAVVARDGVHVRGPHPLAPILAAVGDLKCIADVMTRHAGCADTQLNACSALVALASISPAAARNAADAGLLDLIVKAAWRFGNDKSLQVSALRSAVEIVGVDVGTAIAAMEGRLFDVALTALGQPTFLNDPEAAEAACNAVWKSSAAAINISEGFFGDLDPKDPKTPIALGLKVVAGGAGAHANMLAVGRLAKAHAKAKERAVEELGAGAKLRSAMVTHRGNREVVTSARLALVCMDESADSLGATEQPKCAPALGTRVLVSGLTSARAADLNGEVGTVLRRSDGPEGRVTVQLNTEEEPIALRLERLLVSAAADPLQGGAASPEKEERRQRRRDAKALESLFAQLCDSTRAVADRAEADGSAEGFAMAAAQVAAAAKEATAAAGQRGAAQGRGGSAACAKCGSKGGDSAAAAQVGAAASTEEIGKARKKLQLCSRCVGVRYCSVECQKAHWKEHKGVCVPVPKPEVVE